jgi:hypothetical protein
VFWTPYVFIDYSIGMATGREVWGWPKVGATIRMPWDDGQGPFCECTTLIFREFDPQREGKIEPLLSVVSAAAANPGPSQWNSPGDAVQALAGGLAGELAEAALALGLMPAVPVVQLKQFPDSANPSQACYQALVNSPCQLTAFTGGGVLNGDYTIQVANCASHQIIGDLLGGPPAGGVGTTNLQVTQAAWAAFDFEALLGDTV